MFKNLSSASAKFRIYSAVLSIASLGFVNAQQWQNVGANNNVSSGGSSFNNLVVDNVGNYYLSYYDVPIQKGSVQKFDGSSWSYVGGNPGITTSFATYNSLSISPSGSDLYYTNQGSGLEVRRFDGTSWSQLPSTTTSTINYHASAVSQDNILYTYSNLNSGVVNRLVNGNWEQVGNAGFSEGATFAEMVMGTNNKIYTSNVSGGIRVYVNTTTATPSDNWSLVGGALVDAASSGEQYTADIAIDAANNIYAAYVSNSTNSRKVNVKKFNGTTWEQIGNAYFSSGGVQHVALAVASDGRPYVVASRWENDNFLKNTAYQLDTASNTWTTLGGDFISDGQATYNDLVVDNVNNYLVLAYSQDFTKVKRISLSASVTPPPTTNPTTPPASACTIVPVPVSGFNADVVAEGSGGNTADKTTHTVDAFYTFYSKDFVPADPHSSGANAASYGGGLPVNGTLASSSVTGLTFQMENYSVNNALILRNNVTNTGTLNFTTPKKAEKIYIAAVRGEGGSGTGDNHDVTATIHFADGTAQNTVFQATAWWFDNGAASNLVLSGTGEVSRNTSTSGWAPRNEFRGLTQASLYYNELIIETANQNKEITSISFNKSATSNDSHTTAILAISVCETQPAANTCNNADPGNNPGDTGCVTFNYKGQSVMYTTVRGADGQVWLQQNLGSSQVATSMADADAYGDLFQWGRWDDGHQNRNSAIAPIPSPNSPAGLNGTSSFITGSLPDAWWAGNNMNDLWTASDASSATASMGADPCKVIGNDWKMPSQAEWTTAVNSEGISNPTTAFNSTLKLPAGGNRSFSSGNFSFVGQRGYFWSSTTSSSGAKYLYVGSTIANPSAGASRGQGSSVRCIKDTAGSLGTSDIRKAAVGVYPNPTSGILIIKADSAVENINVTNAVGRRMMVSFSNNQINMSALSSGLYIVEIQLKNGQKISKKIIKK